MVFSKLRQTFSPAQRFNRDAIWNLGSLAVLAAAGIVLNFIVAKAWPKEALGVFNQVYAIYIVLSQLAVGGVHASVLKQVSYQQEDMRAASLAATSGMMLGAVLAAGVCLLGFAASHGIGVLLKSSDVTVGLRDALPGLFFFSLNKILLNVLNGARHMRSYAVFSALRFLFILAGVGGVYAFGFHYRHLAAAFSGAEILLFAMLVVYIRLRMFEFRVAEDWRARIRSHFDFGVRGFLASLVSDLNTRVDAIMLGYYFPDATVGLYSMASTAAEGFYQFPVVIQRNVNPLVGKAFAENDLSRIEWIARKTRRMMWAIMVGIAAVAIVVYGPLVRYFFPEKGYDASWMAFGILLVGIVIQSGFAPMGGILFQGGLPGAQTMLMVYVVVTNIVLNLLLIPIWGINGSAAATGVAYVLQGVLTVIFAKRLLGVKLWP